MFHLPDARKGGRVWVHMRSRFLARRPDRTPPVELLLGG